MNTYSDWDLLTPSEDRLNTISRTVSLTIIIMLILMFVLSFKLFEHEEVIPTESIFEVVTIKAGPKALDIVKNSPGQPTPPASPVALHKSRTTPSTRHAAAGASSPKDSIPVHRAGPIFSWKNMDTVAISAFRELSDAELGLTSTSEPGTANPPTQKSTGAEGSGRVILEPDRLPATPKRISGNSPEYPKSALRKQRKGEVKAKLLVDESGQVESIEILEGSDQFGFVTAVKEATKNWRFEPILIRNKPTAFYVIYPAIFNPDKK